MKPYALALSLFLAVGAPAAADLPGSDWMTPNQVTRKLESLGYTNVTKLEADDGHWEGEATKDGTTVELHVDPHTGRITKTEPTDDAE